MEKIELIKQFSDFLEAEVFPMLKISEINSNNIEDVYEFIVDKFEIPYIYDKNPKLKFIDSLLNTLDKFRMFN